MSPARRVVLRSPAKVNPRLEVLARRPDGQHEVRTTLLALDLEDELELTLLEAGRLEVTVGGPAASEDVPRDGSNLALRAARLALDAFEPRLAERTGLRLHLEKHIPSQAGLGGGSSNAAAAALGVCRLLDGDPDDPGLLAALGRLGADVPFFLAARRTGWALAAGRGERVEARALPHSERALVVLTPDVTCATGAVYAALAGRALRGAASGTMPEAWLLDDLRAARASLVNDLEPAALRSHPSLDEWRRELNDGRGEHFRLSGSGSSFFGLFADRGAAEAFLADLPILRTRRDHGLRVARVVRPAGHGASA